jgi:hypothetical protein
MTTITVFNADTGCVIGTITSTGRELELLKEKYPNHIDGDWPGDQYYMANGQPQLREHTMPVPGADQLRRARAHRLRQIDRITPMWWESLTAEQQQEVRDYRQALLDVPQQPGFPADVTWPEPPQWL